MKSLLCTFLLAVLLLTGWNLSAQNYKIISSTDYPTTDIGVATYNVMDYRATNDGTGDNTQVFQTLLNLLATNHNDGGNGVLYVPAGMYRFTGRLTIPKGVTIRGDWRAPEKGKKADGTILMPAGNVGQSGEDLAFITMQPSSAVMNLSFWYTEQVGNNIKPFPPTIVFGQKDYFGNDCCCVRNVTFINSYIAMQNNRSAGICACINVYNVYGTPLYRGLDMDLIADVCKFDFIRFSSDYWAESGLSGAPAKGSVYAAFMKENATAIEMRRNDWSYVSFAEIKGYRIGFHGRPSRETLNANTPGYYPSPNGHNYGFVITDCETAVCLDGVANEGILFTDVTISDCDNGFVINPNTVSTQNRPNMLMNNCDIAAREQAIAMNEGTQVKLLSYQCTIRSGEVNVKSSDYVTVDCNYMNDKPQLTVDRAARLAFSGNRFYTPNARQDEVELVCRSGYSSIIDHTPLNRKAFPSFPDVSDQATPKAKPAKSDLYVVTNDTYQADPTGKTDATQAIQAALDDAGTNKGGIVYLPGGNYKLTGSLMVPSGVELKGAIDLPTTPISAHASVLEIYGGKGAPTGDASVQLKANSGIRGITFNYPEQGGESTEVWTYPYAMQGQGSHVYIVNVNVRACYQGIDLTSYRCDNHLVDYFAGNVLKQGIQVGKGSRDGRIYNAQFNPICWHYSHESKWGQFPNGPKNLDAYQYVWNNLDFITLGDCENQLLYNNFIYGANRGLVFTKEGKGASGISLGLGIDAAIQSLYYEALNMEKGGFDLINSQLVAVQEGTQTNKDNSAYIMTSTDFDGESTLYGSDYWGSSKHGVVASNGTINLVTAYFHQPCTDRFIRLNDTKVQVNLLASSVEKRNFAYSGNESHITVQASVADPQGTNLSSFKLWKNNLSNDLKAASLITTGKPVVLPNTTGTAAVDRPLPQVYYADGMLYLNGNSAATRISLFDLSGRLLMHLSAMDRQALRIPSGFYLVKVDAVGASDVWRIGVE